MTKFGKEKKLGWEMFLFFFGEIFDQPVFWSPKVDQPFFLLGDVSVDFEELLLLLCRPHQSEAKTMDYSEN